MSVKVTVTVEVDDGPQSAYFKHTRTDSNANPRFYAEDVAKALAGLRASIDEVMVRAYGDSP